MKYHLMPLVVFALVLLLEASGTVLPVAPLVAKQPWSLPGNEQGALLKEGEETMIPLEVPALGVKEQQIA